MKYYKLTITADERVIGQFPQTSMVKIGDFGLEENIRLGYDGPISKISTVPEIRLENKALVTDVIDSVYLTYSCFFVINPHLLDLFKEFNIPLFEVFDLPVYTQNKTLDYKLFHIAYPSNNAFVDFEASEFYVGKRGKEPSDLIIAINNFKEYRQLQKQTKIDHPGKNLLCKKLILNLGTTDLDLFRLTVVPALGYFVSERLKHAIEAKGLTRFDFKEIEEDSRKIEINY